MGRNDIFWETVRLGVTEARYFPTCYFEEGSKVSVMYVDKLEELGIGEVVLGDN
jgi:hypothetical protein